MGIVLPHPPPPSEVKIVTTKNMIIIYRCVGQMVSPTLTCVPCAKRPADLAMLSSAVIMGCAGGFWDFVQLGKVQG